MERRTRLRTFASREEGTITVEFVVMLPVVLAALAFTFEFGRALWAHHVLSENVRSASRYLARTLITDDTRAVAANIATSGDPSVGGTFWGEAVLVEVDPDCRTFTKAEGYRANGKVLCVQASVPLKLAMLAIIGRSNTIRLAAASQARHIGE